MHPIVYVLRHGQTEWNRERRVQGSSESHLTPLGRAQAAAQGRILAPILVARPDMRLVCSPLIRTRQTAELALAGALERVTYDPRLAEVHMGDWEGHLRADLEPHHPILRDPHTAVLAQCVQAPNGEDFEALHARVADFLTGVEGPTVVVSHGITGAVLRGILMGLDFDGMADLDHGQGCVYVLENGTEVALSDPQ